MKLMLTHCPSGEHDASEPEHVPHETPQTGSTPHTRSPHAGTQDTSGVVASSAQAANDTTQSAARHERTRRLWTSAVERSPVRSSGFRASVAAAMKKLALVDRAWHRGTLEVLTRAEWPGNVRQLENTRPRENSGSTGSR